MAYHNNFGKYGEKIAANFLRNKGLTIKELNWHFSHLEIDIIAETDREIVFVEVKTRKTPPDFLYELVTPAKQKRIVKAADEYIRRNDIDKEARFDIIVITGNKENREITHIESAFYPSL